MSDKTEPGWGTGFSWDQLIQQPILTEAERALRDKFVAEYLFDFNPEAAAIRIGFMSSVAGDFAQQLIADPYVARQIADKQRQADSDPKAAKRQRMRTVEMALLREAHYHGGDSSHAARISALAKLAVIYGMDAPTKIEQKVTHRGGVMVIPAIANVQEWQRAAQASQQRLIEEAQG